MSRVQRAGNGKKIRPEIIHSDSRSAAESADILRAVPLAEAYALTAFCVNPKDYLRFRLSETNGWTDFSDAACATRGAGVVGDKTACARLYPVYTEIYGRLRPVYEKLRKAVPSGRGIVNGEDRK